MTSNDHPTYTNPVYRATFADPFVLKHCGIYWAYATGVWSDGRVFGILSSHDLVHWQEHVGALAPLPGEWPCYWAPEVTERNGRFYLYYSAGNETRMHIRVAVAESPAGPFVDSGRILTHEPFAIDAHVFRDDDGREYLFYATDFLEHSRVGTGTAVDELLDPFTLAGRPTPVTRARFDWQIYDPQRAEKGGVRWHTIEGSFTLKRKGVYYQLFSGGNWQNPSYGVSYGTSREIQPNGEWQQVADGAAVLPILRSAGNVIGPGHNSVVRGPDNRALYCVYHRWAGDGSGRQMAIDRLEWTGERLLVWGPTDSPQPAPNMPSIIDSFRAEQPAAPWRFVGGEWERAAGELRQTDAQAHGQARLALGNPHVLVEVTLRLSDNAAEAGIDIGGAAGDMLRCRLVPERGALELSLREGSEWRVERLPLPPSFAPAAFHLLRIELNGVLARARLSDVPGVWNGVLSRPAQTLALYASGRVAFAGFALTEGWDDQFDTGATLAESGWAGDFSGWQIVDGVLCGQNPRAGEYLVKGPLPPDFAVESSLRIEAEDASAGRVTWALLGDGPEDTITLSLGTNKAGWELRWQTHDDAGNWPLPAGTDMQSAQNLAFHMRGGRLVARWEGTVVGMLTTRARPALLGIGAHGARACFDMIRAVRLSS